MTRRKLIRNTSAGIALGALASPMSALAQDSDKPTIKVGAKNYTEQHVMAEFLALILEDGGYTVEREYGLAGTAILADAMTAGELDIQVETTGTGMIMAGGSLPYEQAADMSGEEIAEYAYSVAKEGYAEQFDIAWLEPFGFANPWGMAVTRKTAEEYGLKTMSELENVAGDLTLGTDLEFPVREDGLPRFEEAYGFTFGDISPGDPGLMYQAVDQGEVDIISAYPTDGRIYALDLVLLEDDKNYSLPYYPTPLVRQSILDNDQGLADSINMLGGEITVREMADLNYEVDNNDSSVTDVAHDFLVEHEIIEAAN